MSLWIRGAALALPASGGYFMGNYAMENGMYAPVRSRSWVRSEMDSTKSIAEMQKDERFQQLSGSPKLASFHGVDGAVSEETMSFRDKKDSEHTVTYVHCGPFTVGYPFLVHGGVLGSLLRHSAQLAYSKEDIGRLSIRYRRPTLVDNILKIETQRAPDGLAISISNASTGKLLVEAHSVK